MDIAASRHLAANEPQCRGVSRPEHHGAPWVAQVRFIFFETLGQHCCLWGMNAQRISLAALFFVASFGTLLGAGCAATEESEDVAQSEQKMVPGPGTSQGCSNAEIRAAQSACRSFDCPRVDQGSRGVHSCEHDVGSSTFTYVCACTDGPLTIDT
jgi:hypothetical protein